MTRVTFGGTVTEGRVKPDSPQAKRLAKWEGRRVVVTVSLEGGPKTQPQLGYYWSTVIPEWGEHAGYTPDEMHVELWRAFGATRLVEARLTGETMLERPRVSDYTVAEMSGYLDRVLREAAHQGMYITPASFRS